MNDMPALSVRRLEDLPIPILTGKRFDGLEIRVRSVDGPVISGPITSVGSIWEKATGARISVTTEPYGSLFQSLSADLRSGEYFADLINVQAGWSADFMDSHLVMSAPEDVLSAVGVDDYYPCYRQAMSWNGQIRGLVYDGNVHNLFYRRDLFKTEEYRRRFEDQFGYPLAVPKDWRQFHDVAAFFNGFDWSGTGSSHGYVEPTGPRQGAYHFLLNRAFSYLDVARDPYVFFDVEDMRPRIDGPGWCQALEEMRETAQAGSPGTVPYTFAQCRGAFVGGRAAMIIYWGDIGPLSYAPESKIRGLLGTTLTPGATSVLKPGGSTLASTTATNHSPYLAVTAWLFCVPTTARHQEAAWDLAAFLCGAEASAQLVAFPDTGVNPSRMHTIANPGGLVAAGMPERDARDYLDGVGRAISHPNAVLDLRIPGAGEYYGALDDSVALAMSGGIDPRTALKQAAESWDAITERLGRQRQGDLYVRSVTAMSR